MSKHPLFNEEELQAGLQELAEWKIEDGKWLVRKRLFGSFRDAVVFVGKVADIAEDMNHHPFIGIDFKRVTLRLTTWNSGGLTSLDIDSAKAYDRL
ncbi:4a-hydroxytetrahydrobiopterin dehydratase [Cohnella luojiensis]|uniref:4a-hydroxytetrahydrobiopterin dehydratase n=1 Tax=Cohnella luojiensis TaxID=652876 RepID=A0A4Y8LW11_9BACL|nr:4a-hydroxytetrahydrobiopterin dehydratase [Cohnella luojiensis]TFE24002.1 4a-hydroxytetrahydrobiopterin dehydratase [Cohnella luojiensis]